MVAPLAIIQARLHSTRLPNKMLLPLGGKPLLRWGWDAAVGGFGRANVVIATPAADVPAFMLALPDAEFFGWDGDENDVLGRLHACAHRYRTAPSSALVRITPDDLPIDMNRESFSLEWLDAMQAIVTDPVEREHVGLLLPGRFEINTQADLDAAQRFFEHERRV